MTVYRASLSISRIRAGSANHRYWVILSLTFGILLFAITAPQTDWARATAVALQGLCLMAAMVTSGLSPAARDVIAPAVVLASALAGIAAATVGLSAPIAALMTSVFAGLTTLALVTGLARAIAAHGVTLQEVLGGIAVYLMLGGFFTFAIATAAAIDPSTYFVQGTDGTLGEYVYFSFTVLTTTGFGDFTAATSGGRAIAVLEMLAGQIYLVTVISVLVSAMRGRRS
jgi:hypothetical protein